MRKLHGSLTMSLPTIVPLQCLPNELLQDWWVGEELHQLEEGLHQQKSTASGGTVRTTGPVGGGTSITLVVVRRTPRSVTAAKLNTNDGDGSNKIDFVVSGIEQSVNNELLSTQACPPERTYTPDPSLDQMTAMQEMFKQMQEWSALDAQPLTVEFDGIAAAGAERLELWLPHRATVTILSLQVARPKPSPLTLTPKPHPHPT